MVQPLPVDPLLPEVVASLRARPTLVLRGVRSFTLWLLSARRGSATSSREETVR